MKRRARQALAGMVPLSAAAATYWGVGLAVLPPARWVFSTRVLYQVRTDRPMIALTFDDGPDPAYIGRFLDALGSARATFFVLGNNVRRWPRLTRDISSAGHEVACHGDVHRNLAALGPGYTLEALRRAHASIGDAVGRAPRFYRPAYGVFNLPAWLAAPELGMRRTLWSAWARDWEERATPELIRARILQGARPGAILLLHDADGSPGAPERTLGALPGILKGLRERGLEPVTMSELTQGP